MTSGLPFKIPHGWVTRTLAEESETWFHSELCHRSLRISMNRLTSRVLGSLTYKIKYVANLPFHLYYYADFNITSLLLQSKAYGSMVSQAKLKNQK